MDDSDISFAVGVGMGVAFIRNAVRRPPRMADTGIAVDRTCRQSMLQLRNLAGSLAGLHTVAIHHRDAGGVVAAVLHPLQALEQEAGRGTVSDVSDNPTHRSFG